MVKVLTIGSTIIKCIRENGREDFHMEKECILARMFMRAHFQMDLNTAVGCNPSQMGINTLDNTSMA